MNPKRGRPAKRRIHYNWSSVDWSLSNTEIAKSLGCSPCTPWFARRKAGAPPIKKHRYDWSSVDWSLSNTEIAKILGCPPSTPWTARRKAGIPPSQHTHHPVSKYDWNKIDWALSDTQLAKNLDCSREYVRVKRKKLGKPTSPNFRKRTSKTMRSTCEEARNSGMNLSSMTTNQIAANLGVSYDAVTLYCPERLKQRYDWTPLTKEMCLSHTDIELATIIGCCPGSVARKRKTLGILRKKGPKPKP